MDTTAAYFAENAARSYTRDRIRAAEARRAARIARLAERERRYVESPAAAPAVRRRWIFSTRPTAA